MTNFNVLNAIHSKLLPPREDLGLSPYINLIFLSLLFGNLYYSPVYGVEAAIMVVGLCLFFAVYFRSFWADDKEIKFLIGAVCGISVVLSEINLGGSVVFVYAAGMCGLISNHNTAKQCFRLVIAFIVIYSLVTSKSSYFWIPALFMSISIGLLNLNQIALKRSREEIAVLAKIAERERISRDLHDLLGHSLSVITIKSELASKMLEMGQPVEKVRAEVQSVEQLSRETLAQVRNAVKGYNQATINEELQQAKVATDAAGIRLITEISALSLPTNVESELALIIREAITNVIRHANTSKAWVRIEQDDTQLILSVSDEGQMESHHNASGMSNMLTRIENLNGKMTVLNRPHTQLKFEFALPLNKPEP